MVLCLLRSLSEIDVVSSMTAAGFTHICHHNNTFSVTSYTIHKGKHNSIGERQGFMQEFCLWGRGGATLLIPKLCTVYYNTFCDAVRMNLYGLILELCSSYFSRGK